MTNTDSDGLARISLGAAGQHVEAARFEFALAPQESRVFPFNSRCATGDSYTLAIYKHTGALIFLKSIKRGAIAAPIIMTLPAPTIPTPIKTVATGAKELTVKARLVAGSPSNLKLRRLVD